MIVCVCLCVYIPVYLPQDVQDVTMWSEKMLGYAAKNVRDMISSVFFFNYFFNDHVK